VSTEDNKAIYRRFIEEGFNKGNLNVLDEVLSPDYVYHDAPPGTPTGREGVKQVVSTYRGAFPDLKITIEDQAAEGDKVSSRTTMRGTHQGTLTGISPTRKHVEVPGLTMVRIKGGKIAESWVENDVVSLYQQLGASPMGR